MERNLVSLNSTSSSNQGSYLWNSGIFEVIVRLDKAHRIMYSGDYYIYPVAV